MNKSEENALRESLYTKEANDQYRDCLAFLTRYFSFCEIIIKNDQSQKAFRGMTFHRNPTNVCKTSFRRSECCLDISLASGRVKITR